MNCTYAISGKCESNLFLKVSSAGGFAGSEHSGLVVMTPKVGRQDWKADRGGEPVNQEELGARARESDKKKQKKKREKSQPLHL